MARVLVADDEHAICDAFRQLLAVDGHEAIVASTGRDAVAVFAAGSPAAVFLDVQLPDVSGLDVLRQMRELDASVPVIIMTAHGSVETAMEAVALGAFDYLGKPLDLPEIRKQLSHALHQPEMASTIAAASAASPEGNALIGTSRAMQEIFKMIGLLTTNDLTVLITGESGVGKDLVAKNIHQHGPRRASPFIAINCAAIPEQLVESELFGHEKGAFTGAHSTYRGRFEAAGEGTIFLDEISELPYHLQSKLLRVLEERSFERVGSTRPIPLKARVLAASNRPLDGHSEKPAFRPDLYYRLSLINLHIPPLRQHLEDMPLLATHFLRNANASLNRQIDRIEPAALQQLLAHRWPGNIRELENTIKRSALTSRGNTLSAHDLQFDEIEPVAGESTLGTAQGTLEQAARSALRAMQTDAPNEAQPYRSLVNRVETALINEALDQCGNNQVAASNLLGINRTTLRSKLHE